MWLRVADYTEIFVFRNQFELFLDKKKAEILSSACFEKIDLATTENDTTFA